MIRITKNISINESELKFNFIRSSGPGGQNVNKVSTAVQIKFDVINSMNLPDYVKNMIFKKAGRKISKDGIITIEAKRFRTQEKNRLDAIERLVKLISDSAVILKKRKKTKPGLLAIEKRISDKKKRSQLKNQRDKKKYID
ncbi:MAG: aminoacyl-tRNA hydrolase [Ignavibacteriales bacterium]|nr:aminoacyl-tRNA hydrolase [Ignavibacteriales bacterium]